MKQVNRNSLFSALPAVGPGAVICFSPLMTKADPQAQVDNGVLYPVNLLLSQLLRANSQIRVVGRSR